MFAFCLFCETQRCKTIAEYISKNYGYTCICPQIIQRKWIKGVPREEYHHSLPGYVFLYTEEEKLPHFGISRTKGKDENNGCFKVEKRTVGV